jgi:hypothetical protein
MGIASEMLQLQFLARMNVRTMRFSAYPSPPRGDLTPHCYYPYPITPGNTRPAAVMTLSFCSKENSEEFDIH